MAECQAWVDVSADRKLTLAYMSSDFRTHSVAYFFEPLLEKHDRSQFRIVMYSNTSRRDRVTEEFKKASDWWIETVGLTDEMLVKRIREDKVDILVDLGHGRVGEDRRQRCKSSI